MTGRVRFSGATLVALAVGLALSGCATAPVGEAGPWTSGRMSLRVDASTDRPSLSVTASFELRGSGQQGELRLLSPLGTQQAAARWAPGQAVLVTAQGSQQYNDLNELSREALGEPLPLAALPDWLRGRPWAEAPAQVLANGFEQLGWSIGLARFRDGFVEARRSAPPVVQLRVQLDRGD